MTDQRHPNHEHTLSTAIRAFAPSGTSHVGMNRASSLTDSSNTVTIRSARDLPAALKGVLTP
jgi:hypothetical protein